MRTAKKSTVTSYVQSAAYQLQRALMASANSAGKVRPEEAMEILRLHVAVRRLVSKMRAKVARRGQEWTTTHKGQPSRLVSSRRTR